MKKKRRYRVPVVVAVILVLGVLAAFWLFNFRGETDIVIDEGTHRLTVTSAAFSDNGLIPVNHTGRGDDLSPDFKLADLEEAAVSIAIIMDDLDVPWIGNYNHWVIWNIPAADFIPPAISLGETVDTLGGAVQGIGYGKNRYRGPNPPFGTHRYMFHIFTLDTMLELDASAGKKELLNAMDGHILQYGSITGWYPREG